MRSLFCRGLEREKAVMNDIGVVSKATEEVQDHSPGGAGITNVADGIRRGGTGTDSSPGLKSRRYHIDNFEGRDKKFAAFFNLVPNDIAPEPTPDEHAYVKYFNGTIGSLADYELRDENGDRSQVNLPEILVVRDEFAVELRNEARDFIDGYPVFDCVKTTAKRRGRFEERVNAIRQNNRVVTVFRSPGSEIDDIRFNVLAANLTDGQQKLIIEVQ